MRNAQWPDIQLSEQVLLSCDKQQRGCSGGWPLLAFKFIKENGITDNTCAPYQALGHKNGLDCSDQVECMDCDSQGCYPKDVFQKYYVEEYGFLSGEQEMLEEIYQNGPIVCSCSAPAALHTYTTGVFTDNTGRKSFDHECEIVGFGVENNTKYWQVRNTWGTQFGDGGFFKVARGINNIAIETNCSWVLPQDTWSKGKEVVVDRTLKAKYDIDHAVPETKNHTLNTPCRDIRSKFKDGPLVRSTVPGEIYKEGSFPSSFDWRDLFDFNFVSRSTHQNVPNYCESCWAFAPSSALADRFMIQSNRSDLTIALSAQSLINCKAGGSCSGGNPAQVYEFAYKYGIPDSSCLNYEGKDSDGK